MAARRSKKRKRRDRGRFSGLYKLLSIVIILGVVAAGCMVFFRVNDITTAGECDKYTAEEIIAASGIQPGDNLLLLNKSGAAGAIVTGLPYVDQVNILRVLPDGVVITVSQCTPAAVIQGGGGWWIIDERGKLLEQETGKRTDLARIAGLEALLPTAGAKLEVQKEDVLRLDSLKQLLKALADREMMDKVSAMDLTGPSGITLEYDGRFTVKLPMTADFAQKMLVLESTVSRLQPNEAGSIDLTREDKVYFNPS